LRQAFEERMPVATKLRKRASPKRFLWPAAAIAATIALLFWTILPPKLDAEEILDHTIQAENRDTSNAKLIRVRSGNASCEWPIGASTSCPALENRLQKIDWNWRSPLSAAAFRRWHDRVARKTDTTTRTDSTLRILTRTTASPIHMAELT